MKHLIKLLLLFVGLNVFGQAPVKWISRTQTVGVGDSLLMLKESGGAGYIDGVGDGALIRYAPPSTNDTLLVGHGNLTNYLGVPAPAYLNYYYDSDANKVLYIDVIGQIGQFLGTSANFDIGRVIQYKSLNGRDSVQVYYVPEVAWIETGNSGADAWAYNKATNSINWTLQDTLNENVFLFSTSRLSGSKFKHTKDHNGTRTPYTNMMFQTGGSMTVDMFDGTDEGGNLSLTNGDIYTPFRVAVTLDLDSNVSSGGMNMIDLVQTLYTRGDTLTNYQRGMNQGIVTSGTGVSTYVVNEAFGITADTATIQRAVGWELDIDTMNGGHINFGIGFESISLFGDSSALIFADLGAIKSTIANKNYWALIHDTLAHGLVPDQFHIGNSGAMTHPDVSIDLRSPNKAMLLNRLDTVHRDNLTPAEGMMIYSSTHKHPEYYDGSRWQSFVTSQVPVYKSYNFSARTASSGTRYLAGYYEAPAADANLTNASTTVVLGTANLAYAAHAFIVAGGAGATDGSDLVLTVSGTSITDAGVRTAADSEIIVADATTSIANQYYETPKKWIGQVTYTLTSTGGSTFSYDFNYGFSKYDDWGNNDFYITDLECVGLANNTDSGFEIELLKHNDQGWTYSAAAFEAGNTPILTLNGSHGTEDDIGNGIPFAFKRTGINNLVFGSADEGFIIRVTTTVNNTVSFMNAHIGVEVR